jgi:hypothetical protein
MRPLLFALIPALLSAAPALEIIRPIISQMDGGAPDPAGFEHVAGEIIWVQCRVAGYTRNENQQVHLKYSVQAFDPKGLPIDEAYSDELKAELSVQDKEWLPRIATSISLPPLAGPGAYKILVKVEDVIAKANTEFPIPLKVRAREVEPSDTLIVRNVRFYRDEDGNSPAEKAVFKPGDGVFARFDIIGYKFGPKNRVDVSYITTVIAPTGKVLWTQPEPAVEQSEAFYPQRYVPAAMGINLQKTIKPGEYKIGVQVKDAVGNQTYETQIPFLIE